MPRSPRLPFRPSLSLTLLTVFFCVLWIAGGASRADVLGQAVVRGTAWLLLVIAILAGERPLLSDARPVAVVLCAAGLLAVLQLIPLPHALWQALPGRAPLEAATRISGQAPPWRPVSIVPGATLNALSSLVVPAVTLFFAAGVKEEERRWLPVLLLGLIVASTMVGLVQFSGAVILNPLINDSIGQVSGSFANRNHFALFLAFGCLLAPIWAFREDQRSSWRVPVSIGLVLLFVLTILATGSRAGLLLGGLALGIGALLAWSGIRRELRHYPRWVLPAGVAAIGLLLAVLIGISVAADRAIALNRAFAVDQSQDMRNLGLPTVLSLIGTYFPVGSGLGGFDPIFRIREPFALLRLTYFNHAHNDFLEIVLDCGLPGLLLVAGAIGWWAMASVQVWRRGGGDRRAGMPGSAILFLTFIASIFDYPARTPMVMAVLVVAAMWLSRARRPQVAVSFTRG